MTDEARDVIARWLANFEGWRIGEAERENADAILAALTAAGHHLLRWQDIAQALKLADDALRLLVKNLPQDSPEDIAAWGAIGAIDAVLTAVEKAPELPPAPPEPAP